MIKSFDVVIIGAGIAGCHLAQLLASNNCRVALIDQKPLEQAGPQWINAVPPWMFDEAGLSYPEKDELFDRNNRFIIRAPDNKSRLCINELGVFDVHMGLLGQRLKQYFLHCKDSEFFELAINCFTYDEDHRLREIGSLEDKTIRFRANLFVDASGIGARIRKHHPLASRFWPATAPENTCTAAQMTLEIKDRHGAASFLETNAIEKGDILADVGFLGGYSLFRCQIDNDLNHISLLTGIRALKQFGGGANAVIAEFLRKHPWIGKNFIEGRGAIPINAPYRQLVAPGFALLGDAGCQVYAAHGSGIGLGLIAAKLLSDAVIANNSNGLDVGASSCLLSYQRQFHHKYYQRLYFSEYFRKFSQGLDIPRMSTLIASGIFNETLAKQTLLQQEPVLSRSILASLLKGALKAPKLFTKMTPTFSRALLGKMYAQRLSNQNYLDTNI